MTSAVATTSLDGLDLIQRGKVRDIYAVGDDLLIVATDRLSAYDVVLSPPIPDKGRVLTQTSMFWFEALADVVPNHVITTDVGAMPEAVQQHAEVLEGRCMLVERLEMFPVECVARGYLVGSGWRDYQRTGAVCGHELPPELPLSARLDPPLFTPATKAETGHDENIDFEQAAAIIGHESADALRTLTLDLYGRAREIARERGIIIADTKFEFGRDKSGRIVLGDEALTPDSSRFWDASRYEPGKNQESFDKQYVRDWLDEFGWDHNPPAPQLPEDVVSQTSATYRTIYERLTGRAL